MILVGFDTSTSLTVVGLRLPDGQVIEATDIPRAGDPPGHSTRLLALAEQLLAQARLSWDAIDRIAVGVGPGTFTGLRIGVATARGLAQSLAVELVGVCSLRALARPALAAQSDHRGKQRGVLAMIDARRGELFLGGYTPERELIAPVAVAPEGVGALLQGVGEQSAWLAVGDGAQRFAEQLRDLVEIAPDSSALHLLGAQAICELGASDTPACAAVVPRYCRRPDAEIALEAAR